MQLFAADCIPDLAAEVSCAARSARRGVIQRDTPNGPLVPFERADPVAGVALAQHRFAICKQAQSAHTRGEISNGVGLAPYMGQGSRLTFACRDQEVAAVGHAAEVQMYDGARVPTAGQRCLA